jgi:hypothetical protein
MDGDDDDPPGEGVPRDPSSSDGGNDLPENKDDDIDPDDSPKNGVPRDPSSSDDGNDPLEDKDDDPGEVSSGAAAPHGVTSEGADANPVLASLRSDACRASFSERLLDGNDAS